MPNSRSARWTNATSSLAAARLVCRAASAGPGWSTGGSSYEFAPLYPYPSVSPDFGFVVCEILDCDPASSEDVCICYGDLISGIQG